MELEEYDVMRLAIDVMGGDNAPEAVMSGVSGALKLVGEDAHFLLFGDEKLIKDSIRELNIDSARCSVFATTELIECDEAPVMAIRRKKDSSIVRAIKSVADGDADCVLSAGSSGALLAGATLIIKRQRGVKRPALAPLLPTSTGGRVLLIDCGANTDCKPGYLLQFALMGTEYMRGVLGVDNPRVGLLNNGAEAEKGNELTKATYPRLSALNGVNFIGNVEARDVLTGCCDVVVCDGFDGNILLKASEGMASAMNKLLKTELLSGFFTKIGALLAKPAFVRVKKRMDYTEHGGAPLLGVNGGVIKAHGSSDAKAIMNAILQAERLIKSNVVEIIGKTVSDALIED